MISSWAILGGIQERALKLDKWYFPVFYISQTTSDYYGYF